MRERIRPMTMTVMSTALRLRAITPRNLTEIVVGFGLIVGYVLLDWASYIHPLYGLNITPWNPALALGLLFLLRFGLSGALPLFIAILIAEAWVRGLPISLPATVALSLLLTSGYTAMGMLLRRYFPSGRIFEDRRDLMIWIVIVVVGTSVTSLAFVFAASIAGAIPGAGRVDAFVRLWIGDGVGVLVSMPLLWALADPRGRSLLHATTFRWETAGYVLLATAALWVTFGIGAGADFKYFYVLFLPMVLAASRQGLPGAVISAALLQAGIIVAVQRLGFQAATVIEIQMLAVALALIGFFVGLVVDEQRRMSSELRQSLRLAAAGEMAGALAHELNQPLTAISAYGGACQQILKQGDPNGRLPDVIARMVSESFRAADVLRRLRDFFRTGTLRLEPLRARELVDALITSFEERAHSERVIFTVGPIADALLLADRKQLEIVLRNLLSNAFDAVNARSSGQRWVRLRADNEGAHRLTLTVEDSGAGVARPDALRIFEPFHSEKSSGLGLGLSISRAIVEAHGGNLWAEVADHGIFKLVLPLERDAADASG